MKVVNVAYISKRSRDAVRDVDENLINQFSHPDFRLDFIDMPYIFLQSKSLSTFFTMILCGALFPRMLYVHWRYDIVHYSSTTNYFWYYNLILKKLFRNTISVLTVHHVTLPKNRILKDIYNKLYKSFDSIVAVSKATKEALVNARISSSDRSYVIPNGISKFFYREESVHNDQYVLYVGDEYKRKNLVTALKAFKELLKIYPNIKFYKYGRVNQYKIVKLQMI